MMQTKNALGNWALMKNWMTNEGCVDVDEDVKAQQVPISLSAGGNHSFPCATVTHVLDCLVLSSLLCVLYIYKHT